MRSLGSRPRSPRRRFQTSRDHDALAKQEASICLFFNRRAGLDQPASLSVRSARWELGFGCGVREPEKAERAAAVPDATFRRRRAARSQRAEGIHPLARWRRKRSRDPLNRSFSLPRLLTGDIFRLLSRQRGRALCTCSERRSSRAPGQNRRRRLCIFAPFGRRSEEDSQKDGRAQAGRQRRDQPGRGCDWPSPVAARGGS